MKTDPHQERAERDHISRNEAKSLNFKEKIDATARLLEYVEDGGRVQRMHKVPTLHPQSVAAHSFGVTWWAWILSDRCPSVNLLMACLDHDLPEGTTGDFPAPSKRRLGLNEALAEWEAEISVLAGVPVFELTETEVNILKVADGLELLQHCIRERSLGNRTTELTRMYRNVLNYVKESITVNHEFYLHFLNAKWEAQ